MRTPVVTSLAAACLLLTGCAAAESDLRAAAETVASKGAAELAAAEAKVGEAAEARAATEALLEEAAAKAAADKAAALKAAAAKAAADKAAALKAAADKAAADKAAALKAAADKAAAAARSAADRAAQADVSPLGAGRGAGVDSFDRAYALELASRLVRDIAAVDTRLQDGAAGSALNLLAGTLERLPAAGVPPHVSATDYLARVSTLAAFAVQAADAFDYGSTFEGTAKYAVVREQTGVLLAQLNEGLGTSLALPPA